MNKFDIVMEFISEDDEKFIKEREALIKERTSEIKNTMKEIQAKYKDAVLYLKKEC